MNDVINGICFCKEHKCTVQIKNFDDISRLPQCCILGYTNIPQWNKIK